MKKLITALMVLTMVTQSSLMVFAEEVPAEDEPQTVLDSPSEETDQDSEEIKTLKKAINDIRTENKLSEFTFDKELDTVLKEQENETDLSALEKEYEIYRYEIDTFDYEEVSKLLSDAEWLLSEKPLNLGLNVAEKDEKYEIYILYKKEAEEEKDSSGEKTVTQDNSHKEDTEVIIDETSEEKSDSEDKESEPADSEELEESNSIEEAENSEEAKELEETKKIEETEETTSAVRLMKTTAEPTPAVDVFYTTHLSNVGWIATTTSGNATRSGRIEAFRIYTSLPKEELTVNYQAHVQNIGWMGSVMSSEAAGTIGRSLHIEAIRISLSGEKASLYNIKYRVNVVGYGWTGWSQNGQTSGTEGRSLPLCQIEIKIVPVNGEETTDINEIDKTVSYSAHVQNIGWQGERTSPAAAGTTGRSLRMEALTIRLSDDLLSLGNIQAVAHAQNVGWMNPVGSGSVIGTTGRSLRLEAIKLSLTGDLQDMFDIYYRTHVQNIGWMAWTSNGNVAGTTGRSLAIEAIEIRLVVKDGYTNPPKDVDVPENMLKTGFQYEMINGVKSKVYYDENHTIVKRSFKKDQVYYQLNEVTGAIIHEQKLFCDQIYMHGIDISEHNGDINLADYQNGFVIIRIGYWTVPDKKAVRNMDLCDKYNIPYGVYLYDYTTEPQDAVQEAEFTLRMIQGRNIKCGVWFDMEDDGWRARNGVAPGHPAISEICKRYCETIANAGYHVGIYASYSWFENYITGCDKYDKWVAHWGSNNGQWNNNLAYYAPLHQYTSNGGSLDENVMYVDPYYFR